MLDAARDLYGYDYRRVSTGYMVLPASLQTRMFHLNYLDLKRVGVSKTRISSGQITQNRSSNSESVSAATPTASGDTGTDSSSSDGRARRCVTQQLLRFLGVHCRQPARHHRRRR